MGIEHICLMCHNLLQLILQQWHLKLTGDDFSSPCIKISFLSIPEFKCKMDALKVSIKPDLVVVLAEHLVSLVEVGLDEYSLFALKGCEDPNWSIKLNLVQSEKLKEPL